MAFQIWGGGGGCFYTDLFMKGLIFGILRYLEGEQTWKLACFFMLCFKIHKFCDNAVYRSPSILYNRML